MNNHKCIITYRNKPDIEIFDTKNERLLIDITLASNNSSNILQEHLIDNNTLKESLSFFMAYYSKSEVEPNDEEFLKWKDDYNRWSKIRGAKRTAKRQSLKPEKIENSSLYDKLYTQRKTQYNLKYKIKNNKSLSVEEKESSMEIIESKLKSINLELKTIIKP